MLEDDVGYLVSLYLFIVNHLGNKHSLITYYHLFHLSSVDSVVVHYVQMQMNNELN